MPSFTLPNLPKLSRLWLVLLCLFAYTLMQTHQVVVAQSSEVGKDVDKDDGKDDDSGGGGDSGGSDDSDDDSDDNSSGSDNSGSSDDSDDNSGSGNSGGGSDNDSNDSSSDDNSGNGGNSGDDNSGDDNSGSDNSGDDNSGDGGNSGSGNNGDGGNSSNGNSGNGNSSNDDNDDNNNDDNGNSGNGNNNDNNGGDNKPEDADEARADNSGKDDKDDRLYYVGTVSASDGSSLLADGAKLQSTSPWVEVLGTGMWFEAYGYWQGEDTFIADEVNVLAGDDWAYVRAPAVLLGQREERQIEAWTRGNVIDTQREASQGVSEDSVRVVAYFDGVKVRAVPQALTPPAPDLPAGWVEFTGRFDGDGIVWESSRQFP